MTPAFPLGEFSRYCGPQAVAYLARVPAYEAAVVLQAVRKAQGQDVTTPVVSPNDLRIVLECYGIVLQTVATDPQRPMSVGELRARGRRGTWLVTVLGNRLGHALVVERGTVPVGEAWPGRYDNHFVRRAWRVHRHRFPAGIPRGGVAG